MASRAFKFTSSGKFSERFDTVDGDTFGATDELAAAEVAAGHGVDVSDIEVIMDADGGDPRGSDLVKTVITWDDDDAGMRERRTRRLSETDWTQVPDSALSDAKKAEWSTYRQALRDMPTSTPDANGIEWPVKPS